METPSHDNAIIQGWLTAFASSKKWADGSIEQMSDEQLFTQVAPGFNSVAAIMKHIAGNVKSRWTDWRTTDGEKPWRNRETEFDVEGLTREDVQQLWDGAWVTIYRELMSMTEEDLTRTITIRGEDHTVPEAVSRQLLTSSLEVWNSQNTFHVKHTASTHLNRVRKRWVRQNFR